ncbi:MAG: hypothetical protein ABI947_29565 [Chloroflexota bacterium]
MSIRTELTTANIVAFEAQFGRLHDAVIHQIHYDVFTRNRELPEHIQLVIGAQDFSDSPNRKWVNVTIDMEDIQQVIIKKARRYQISVIFKMHFRIINDEVYLGYNMIPTAEEIAYENSAESSTDLIVVSKRGYWSVSPYQERGRTTEQ